MKTNIEKKNSITPVMQQYLNIKRRFPDDVVFFRLGDFYEMFFEDAVRAAPILEVALTKRQSTPMCGVPHHASTGYISKLLKAGISVAMAEQLEDPKKTKGMVKRDVVRVLTPGTIIEDELLPSKANNFLVALIMQSADKSGFGHWALAAADVSTGRAWLGEQAHDLNWNTLRSQLAALNPSEILLVGDETFKLSQSISLSAVTRLEPHPAAGTSLTDQAYESIKNYLDRYQKETSSKLEKPEPLPLDSLFLDESAIRHLELVESSDAGRLGPTLLSVLDKTVTPLGSRMLRWWLLHPSAQKNTINNRLDQVETLVEDSAGRDDMRTHLKDVQDLERIRARAQNGTASPRDLVSLRQSLHQIPLVQAALDKFKIVGLGGVFESIAEDLKIPLELPQILAEKLAESPPMKISDGGIISEGVNLELDELRGLKKKGRKWIAEMEGAEREKTGITNLKVGYNDIYGYFLEVSRSHLSKVPEAWMRKQTLTNAERYITPELKVQEEKILGAQAKIQALEAALYADLVREVAAFSPFISKAAQAFAHLDTVASLAQVAVEENFLRPQINDGDGLVIQAGRHPVIEKEIGRDHFIPNNVELRPGGKRISIITGPNMAGKSTYLRQTALIVIMAQAGSFVPAESAEIGLVDKIFTRIGASDRLSQGQSTFMVEMSEVATLLANATTRSLLVLDEVGRGTSTYDGVSIAWAVIEYLSKMKSKFSNAQGPKTLFATHYFELTHLADLLPNVMNAHATAKEWPGEDGRRQVVFLYQILPGPADRSYGIHVAEMAGVPEDCIDQARRILKQLESGSHQIHSDNKTAAVSVQMDLFSAPHPIIEELKNLPINQMTPLEALNALAKLKEKL